MGELQTKQNKTKALQSTEVFKYGSKDISVGSIFASMQATSTRGSYFVLKVCSVTTPTKCWFF